MNPDEQYKPIWKNRRRVIFTTLIFCAAIITYLTGWGEDNRLNETIVQFSFILGMAVVGSYVFGSAWEDVTKLRK
jgi:hypothetical protein